MEKGGFTYVPAINGDGGFWMRKYEARKIANSPLTPAIADISEAFITSHFNYLTGDSA